MTEKKLGYQIRPKAEKVNHEVFEEYAEIAKRADDAGLHYLAFPEFFARADPNRIHVVPYMAAIAARTEHVKLGTDVLEIPLFHPKHIADIGASLDIISNGRFILGAGVGMNVPSEFENFGISIKERGKRTDESLDIIKKLWTEPLIAEFNGKFFTLRNVCSPPCIQKPHPPIWVGGFSNAALRRTAQYGNAWAGGNWYQEESGTPEEEWSVQALLEKLKEYCKKFGKEFVSGREPKGQKEVGYNLRINLNINTDVEKAVEDMRHFWIDVRKGRTQGGGSFEMKMRYAAFGKAENVIEKIEELYKAGAYLVIFCPLSTDSASQWKRVEEEVLPSL